MAAAKAPERATPRCICSEAGSKQVNGIGRRQVNSSTLPQLPGINPADGIRYTGSEKMWLKLLGDFYKLIDSKAKKLENCVEDA